MSFNGFPIPTESGGGGDTTVIGGGPYGNITSFPKSTLDSSSFLDVMGWPVPGGATVVALDFNSWTASGGPLNGLDSSGAVIWAATTGAGGTLTTTTGATINHLGTPAWDGSSTDCIVACAPTGVATIYFVSINIQNGTETLLGSVSPATPSQIYTARSKSRMQIIGDTLILAGGENSTGVRSLVVDISGAPSITSEIDTGYQTSTSVIDVTNFGKYCIINDAAGGAANNALIVFNAETGAINAVDAVYQTPNSIMPFANSARFGDLFVAQAYDATNAGIKRVARWNASTVSSYFSTFAEVFGVDGGSL